ncbi:uncharacterized protein LOC122191410 isoform X2 [Lagopus leucura]|uniref:uncharacterized protein LOC122191410 isoform X2 n=1 Tax=Lagopus leucura TaxID=30410 RepID=UPI001C671B7B|nr:uncharacterized protein LOC122191410 isoform X2 [Lagopus leucura]
MADSRGGQCEPSFGAGSSGALIAPGEGVLCAGEALSLTEARGSLRFLSILSPGVSPLQMPAAARPGRETRFASINFIASQDDSRSTKPGVIQPLSRARQNAASHNPDEGDSPNPFQQPEPCSAVHSSPKPPSPPSPDEIPINVKQAYKTFAAVPLSHPLLETQVTAAGWGQRHPNSGTQRRRSTASEGRKETATSLSQTDLLSTSSSVTLMRG